MLGGGSSTLDLSNLPGGGIAGAGVGVTVGAAGTAQGLPSTGVSVNAAFTGFQTIVGTLGGDAFTQTVAANLTYHGGAGTNSLNLQSAPSGVSVTYVKAGSLAPPSAPCTGKIPGNHDGTITGAYTVQFSCMVSVTVPGKKTH